MIIYPPFIRDTIPAFAKDKIVIPFSQNPAVSIKEVTSFGLIVKDYLSSNIIANLTAAADTMYLSYNSDTKSGEVIFDIVKWKEDEIARINADEKITDKQAAIDKVNKFPETKQYYKFQMGYSDDGTYNAYSTASIGRCISNNNSITITDLNSNIVNLNKNVYEGVYISDIASEPIYSYRFVFKNITTNEIVQDTGDILHNVDEDKVTYQNKRISQHLFKINYELQKQYIYELTYSITTINGYKTSTKPYTIIKSEEIFMIFQGGIKAQQNTKAKDNGYIEISLTPAESGQLVRGNFVLERTNDNLQWNELTKFTLTNISDLSLFTWKDWSIEQGIEYTYAIRQYSGNIYSERKLSNTITAEFEHMFLSDGKKQLKIKYNPKVSSFKDTILEQKTDTIGGKYPFFFKNNQVRYKEIPISGLISYQMDEDNLFMDNDELGLIDLSSFRQTTTVANDIFNNIKVKTNQLTDYNYTAERKFKLSVLEWLTNGEPKLFRSPTEGNYVVRLMNTSLSPNDTLGRMLHTFSSTGYEIMDNTIDNLKHYGLINLPELKEPQPQKVLKTLDYNWIGNDETKTFTGKGIEKITWVTRKPNSEDTITVDNETYVNTTSIYTIPDGKEIILTKEILSRGDTITFYYYPEVDLGEDNFGKDDFENIVTNSENILFSAPAGYVLRNAEGTGILNYKEEDSNEIKTLEIYKTYILVVSKDINYISTNPEEDYKLTIGSENINCSDGQIRYYYNLDSSVIYEKGLGLHLDIYARIQSEGMSSVLGKFILGKSKLG